MVEAKSVQKSVRLTPTAYKEIESYRGEGFNEKLANLVDDYLNRKDELRYDWERVNALVNDKRAELKAVQERVRKLRELHPKLQPLVDALLDLLEGE